MSTAQSWEGRFQLSVTTPLHAYREWSKSVPASAVGRTAVVSAEATGEAAGAFVSMIKVEQVNS